MAKILVQLDARMGEWKGTKFVPFTHPYCSGCGAAFDYIPLSLDSRCRSINPYDDECRRFGSKALEIAKFAREHASCPEPTVEVTANGVTVVDKRRWK